MNRIYRSIWNDTTGTSVAVSENAASSGKKSPPGATAAAGCARFTLKGLAVFLMLSIGANVYALPVGGVVSAGSASINSGAGSTTITQSTQAAAINWQSFNIGQREAVRFVQPNSNSVALNRVLGSDPSSILGSLSANGKVFLVNPNGILFGQGASVNVGGLVASTLSITDGDFMAGRYKFAGAGSGTILNQGSINADGGYVALLGATVSNEGVILGKFGTVALAAGNAMTLDLAGDGLLNVTVDQGAVNALVQNGGLIQAGGGQVLLTAQAAGNLLQSVVNNTGVIQAQTIENHKGTIKLLGGMQSGTVNVAGRLDASAPNGGDGGFIETSAAHVKVADNAIVTAQSSQGTSGTWLIDPFDFTIATVGGDITPAALAVNLASNVTISSDSGAAGVNGDINVNNDVTWNAATTLTLNAVRNVNLNANITATTGSLVANAIAGDVIVNAQAGTGITTTDGSITWTAGRDITVKAGVVGGITATRGDIAWTAGRDINVNSAVTTTDGNFTACCGRDINISAAMTMTRGDVVLRAGGDSTGPAGLIGGTVAFVGAGHYTVTGAVGTPVSVTVDYTPTSYATPTNYSGNFTLTDAALIQHMLVFAQGVDKVYDGNTTATLSFRGDPTLGGDVTLLPGTAAFDDKNAGTGKTITYNGYSLGGANAGNFALWATCGDVAGSGTTTANITPAPLTVTASDVSKIYGQTPTLSAFTQVGLVNAETIGSVTETSPGTVATASVVGSPYAITPSAATGGTFTVSNYTIGYVNGALTVNPAGLTVTASDVSKTFGQTSTLSAFTQAGLVNGETIGSVTLASAGAASDATVAGSAYAITPSAATGGTFTASNYTIGYVNGALTVTPVVQPVSNNDNNDGPNEPPLFQPVPVVVAPVTPPVLVVLAPVTPPFSPAPVVVEANSPPVELAPVVVAVVTPPVELAPVVVAPVTPPFTPAPVVVAPVTPPVEPATTLIDTLLVPILELFGMMPDDTVKSAPSARSTVGLVSRELVAGLNLTVASTGVRMPPPIQLVETPLVQPAPVIVAAEKPLVQPALVAVPPETPPMIYVQPRRLPKQDRN